MSNLQNELLLFERLLLVVVLHLWDSNLNSVLGALTPSRGQNNLIYYCGASQKLPLCGVKVKENGIKYLYKLLRYYYRNSEYFGYLLNSC